METSGLSHIVNTPKAPMDMFAQFHDEAKRFSDPNTFADTMCIASRSDDDEILNRNVLMRKFDNEGWTFITERNTKKYKDYVRGTGRMVELTDAEIAEFYKDEPLFAKIRSKICECGAPVEWNELKSKHDDVYHGYLSHKDELTQGANYTAMRIIPSKFDFYYARQNEIADRVKYTLEDGKWVNYHIAA